MRGNFVDVPTDCPQRDERLGWTGDLQVFAPTASFLYDTAGMLRSWLADLAVEQARGPRRRRADVRAVPADIKPPGFPPLQAEAGWGDAAVVVPWVLYERHGDAAAARRPVGQHDRLARRRSTSGPAPTWTSRTAASCSATGWTPPRRRTTRPARGRRGSASPPPTWPGRRASSPQAAEVLGRDGSRVRRPGRAGGRAVPRRVRHPDRPAGVPVADRLRAGPGVRPARPPSSASTPAGCWPQQVAADGFHIASGFLGTPFVTDALTNAGELATAYELLLQRENPSWLYPVTMGATTIWERWDSMLPGRLDQPRRHDVVQPLRVRRGGRLAAPHGRRARAGGARATGGCGSPRARARASPPPRRRTRRPTAQQTCAWTLDGTAFTLDVTVPPNTTAEVVAARRQRGGRGRLRAALVQPSASRSRSRSRSPTPFWAPPE